MASAIAVDRYGFAMLLRLSDAGLARGLMGHA
jgi:hypothetical protein